MAAPVTITFLGGLGEIGRNCMVLEQDDQLLLLDCGLMFPELEHLGVDLILPDFTWLRENADRVIGCIATHGHEDHVGGLSYLLRELSFPDLRLRPHPRSGQEPHRGSRAARPTEPHPGRRRRTADDRTLRRRVHPGHPLGAARLRHRVPHPAGRADAHRRLEARPHAGRRPPHRPRAHGRHRLRAGRPPAHERLHQRRQPRPQPQREERGCACSTTSSTSTRAGAS